MDYFAGGQDVLDRLSRLYMDRDQSLILAAMQVPSRANEQFAREHVAGYCDYPDPHERAAFWDAYLCERAEVCDDSVPTAYLSEMDQALYGGLVGGKARFLCDLETGWISSMVEPILGDLSEVGGLTFDTDGEWFRRYTRQLEIFVGKAQGRFGVSHFILIDGLNFVFELVGATQTYVELLERPELVRQAMEFAFQLNLCVQRAFFETAPLLAGGTCSNMVQWMPGKILSESVDPFHMTSVAYFEEWGRANVERIFAEFDGGALHIHGNGRHLLEAVSSVKGLRAIWLGDDRGFPPAFDVLGELKRRVGDMPLLVTVGCDAFVDALESRRLPGGVFYNVTGVSDADTANRIMDSVRAYEPPHRKE